MEYNRYFWKSGRNQRKRTPEEMANIRKIIFAGVLSILVGMGAGAANLSILYSNVRVPDARGLLCSFM
jgi:hypothetical protein